MLFAGHDMNIELSIYLECLGVEHPTPTYAYDR